MVNRYFIENNNRNDELTEDEREFIQKLDEKRLNEMVSYSLTHKCLRTFILNYFGEQGPENCGGCSNCLSPEGRANAVRISRRMNISKEEEDQELYDALRALRLEIARQRKVPPYQIFSDKTLKDMCAIRPKNKMDFMSVPGVGFMKCNRYGTEFMKVIDQYR